MTREEHCAAAKACNKRPSRKSMAPSNLATFSLDPAQRRMVTSQPQPRRDRPQAGGKWL
jgi:hypothetical protein